LDDSSIDLVITSPPYNIGKDYGSVSDNLTYEEYCDLIDCFVREMKRTLKRDGRFCINIGDFLPVIQEYSPFWLSAFFKKHNLKLRFVISWVKTKGEGKPQSFGGSNTAWGSWLSASAPSLRSHHELILVGYNEVWQKEADGISTISRSEFLRFTQSAWFFPAEAKRQKYHSAPFPEELPYRCMQLFSFKGDLVLDPFSGLGTTCIVAKKLERRYLGFELNEEYYKFSEDHIGFVIDVPVMRKKLEEL